jgi:hypothetical protein
MTAPFALAGVPTPFEWAVPPVAHAGDDATLSITAGPVTDLFSDPGSGVIAAGAPYAATSAPDGDFTFSARVRPQLIDSFDAGCLLVVIDGERWAKLACERSPQGAPMVVSVVTHGRSDDANGMPLRAADVWLRVARIGAAFAFHASPDGSRWEFARHFTLGSSVVPRLGLSAQSPVGAGCTAVFSEVRLSGTTLGDLRDGT